MNGRSFLAAVCLLALSSPAWAQDLRQSRQLLERRRFAEAQAAVDALIQGGGLTPPELAEAYELQGLAFVAAGDKPSAEGAFTTMLSIDPNRAPTGRYALDASDPMVSARTARGEAGALRIDAAMEERWRRGAAPVISAGVFGDSAGVVARLDTYYRPAGQVDYAVKTEQGAGPHRIQLALLAGTSPHPIEYYAEAFDDFGNQLVTNGTPDTPELIDPTLLPDAQSPAPPAQQQNPPAELNLAPRVDPPVGTGEAWRMGDDGEEPEPEDDGPITSKWWFWGGAAALAVGAIAGVVAIASSGSDASATSDCFGRRCDLVTGPP